VAIRGGGDALGVYLEPPPPPAALAVGACDLCPSKFWPDKGACATHLHDGGLAQPHVVRALMRQ